MKMRAILLALPLALWGPAAFAECSKPANDDFDTVATSLFNCSSALPLKGAEGERKFQIHYDFPKSMPDNTKLPWLAVDPFKQPADYMNTLLRYVTKVNARPDIDWRIEDNKEEVWCDAPWFQMLREPLHGMTSERWSRPKELHLLQADWEKNFAVGIYNDVACYGFGQIWDDPTFPKTRDFQFAEGAFSMKMLFSSATPDEVPYLTGSKEWTVAAEKDGSTIIMRLLQMDVSIKDQRSPNGWFFGTFMYDADQPGDTPYDRLAPVGLIWGSDPELTASAYLQDGVVAKESWVNPTVADRFYPLPRHNLGLFGRANGPVDNPKSACITCHQRALDWGRAVLSGTSASKQAAELLPDVPNDPYDEEATKSYFRNIGSNSPVPDTQSLDYVLQASKGIAAFRAWVATDYPEHAATTTNIEPYPFKAGGEAVAIVPMMKAAPGDDQVADPTSNLFDR